jgi:hypothetical protein
MKESLPEWVVVGESILIRPYNSSGVIGYVGTTHFQVSLFHLLNNFQSHFTKKFINFNINRVERGLELNLIHRQVKMMVLFKVYIISIVEQNMVSLYVLIN